MSDVLWRRLRYMLTPQWDIYNSISKRVRDLVVMDIGCGTGTGTLQLARYAKTVAGCDIDSEAVDFAQQVFGQRNLGFTVLDVMALANEQSAPSYQAVTMIEVLEHIPGWQLALHKVHGLLVPGGTLYISARNRNADLRRNDLHEREWTAAEFRAALAGYFAEVKLYDYTLEAEQGDDSRVTPLVAVCVK
jgi:2-polyprenyl-3-methyl-5-hydroxy-6-metoxy-1,4-benzoquinol methylase